MAYYFDSPFFSAGPSMFERSFMREGDYPFGYSFDLVARHPYFGYPKNTRYVQEDEDQDDQNEVCYRPPTHQSMRQARKMHKKQSPRRNNGRQEFTVETYPSVAEQNNIDFTESEMCSRNVQIDEPIANSNNNDDEWTEAETLAARIIQKAFRKHLHQKQNRAAAIITKFMRDSLEYNRIKQHQILPNMKQLKQIRADLKNLEMISVQNRRIFERDLLFDPETDRIKYGASANRWFLEFEDSLTKLMLRVDKVESFGEQVVRQHRKHIISHIQALLDRCDSYKLSQKEQQHNRMEIESEMSDLGSTFGLLFD